MTPPLFLLLLFGLASGSYAAIAFQPSKGTEVTQMESECSITKTVFQLESETKMSLYKLDMWKAEIDRRMVSSEAQEKTLKSNIDEVRNTIEKQTENMTAAVDLIRSKMKEIGVKMESKLNELQTSFENRSENIEAVKEDVKIQVEKIQGALVDQSASLVRANGSFHSEVEALETKLLKMKEEIGIRIEEVTTTVATRRIDQFASLLHLNLTRNLRLYTKGLIGKNCGGSMDCVVLYSQCVDGVCRCRGGLYGRDGDHTCLAGCAKYGNSFTAYSGMLSIHKLGEVTQRNDFDSSCQQACIAETEFTCVSYKWKKRNSYSGTCYLIKHAINDTFVFKYTDTGVTYNYRDCLMPV